MALQTRNIGYDAPGGPFEGILVWDDTVAGSRPGVMICPNVFGIKAFDVDKARALAALGYAGFVADLYGVSNRPEGDIDGAMALMNEAQADRKILQARLLAALATMRGQAEVDAARTAAIGFCFGGKCVLDLARSGADVGGVASFHGVFDAPPFPNARITAKVLVLHGFEDPIANPEESVALGRELTEAGADWQIHLYGNAGHGFTAQGATMPNPGFGYEANADARSWRTLVDFLKELWG